MASAFQPPGERREGLLEDGGIERLAALAVGAHGVHARPRQVQHPADVGGPHEVPGGPQDVGAQDRTHIHGLLQVEFGQVAGALGDGPLRRPVVL